MALLVPNKVIEFATAYLEQHRIDSEKSICGYLTIKDEN